VCGRSVIATRAKRLEVPGGVAHIDARACTGERWLASIAA
jgi:hypothetical protein